MPFVKPRKAFAIGKPQVEHLTPLSDTEDIGCNNSAPVGSSWCWIGWLVGKST